MNPLELQLAGCRPDVLAFYLKGLALLRLVAIQRDPSARGAWRDEAFVLQSTLDRDEIIRFFLEEYRPSPVVSPWNGGSGFFPKDRQDALRSIEGSSSPRLAAYRSAIAESRSALLAVGPNKKPDKGAKVDLLAKCRATFPEEALAWLDSAAVLTDEGVTYAPLLGTGGNDGRLDFSNNFMQQLVRCLDTSGRGNKYNLATALFGEADGVLAFGGASMGQFAPGSSGGPNSTNGFAGDSVANPWDYVLTCEGALAFAGSVARRLSGPRNKGKAAFPFTVNAGTVGAVAVADADAGKPRAAEIWFPLWKRFAVWAEVSHVLAEGRVQWGRHQARNALDFARAVVNLGVHRGIASFERMGLLQRNGRSFLAVHLGRIDVRSFSGGDLLQDPPFASWTERYRSWTSSGDTPASAKRAWRTLAEAIYDCAEKGRSGIVAAVLLQNVLIAVGEAQSLLGRLNPQSRAPIPPLVGMDNRWLRFADDGSPEWRLAAALGTIQGAAGVPSVRVHIEPLVAPRAAPRVARWSWTEHSLNHTWKDATSLAENLVRLLERRSLLCEEAGLKRMALYSSLPAGLEDVAKFIFDRIDDSRVAGLLKGICCVDSTKADLRLAGQESTAEIGKRSSIDQIDSTVQLSRLFAILRLLYWPSPIQEGSTARLPTRDMLRLLRAQRYEAAARSALRQLRMQGLSPRLPVSDVGWVVSGTTGLRLAAALAIPVTPLWRLTDWALKSDKRGA